MNSRKKVGDFGEDIAAGYLKRKGCKILTRNFKKKWGEIDIVAKNKAKIIFCEVKTLRQAQGKPFAPEDEIDWKKKKQVLKMAQIYLSENKIPLENPWQIDIIGIEISPDFKRAKIRHYKNAIEDTY